MEILLQEWSLFWFVSKLIIFSFQAVYSKKYKYRYRSRLNRNIFNRPGVARAVLQSPPLLIYAFIRCVIFLFRIFKTRFLPNRKGWGAKILRKCSPLTRCHMSCVICHVSCVKCHIFFFFYKVLKLFCGGSVINGAYLIYIFFNLLYAGKLFYVE